MKTVQNVKVDGRYRTLDKLLDSHSLAGETSCVVIADVHTLWCGAEFLGTLTATILALTGNEILFFECKNSIWTNARFSHSEPDLLQASWGFRLYKIVLLLDVKNYCVTCPICKLNRYHSAFQKCRILSMRTNLCCFLMCNSEIWTALLQQSVSDII